MGRLFIRSITKLDLYAGDGPNNYAKWHNKEFDALIKEAKVEQNEDKRFELLHKAEDIMFTDSPLIPIIFPSASYLQKSSVSGVQFIIGSSPELRYAKLNKEVGNRLLFYFISFVFFFVPSEKTTSKSNFDSLYQV